MSDGPRPLTVGEALKTFDGFQRARQRVAELEELIGWLGQAVHQAHHEGPLESCPKATCQAVRAAVKP